MKKVVIFVVLLIICISYEAVEARTLHPTALAKRQITIATRACSILNSLVNSIATLVNSIVNTVGNLLNQAKLLIANVKRDVLNVGANVSPAIINCLNGLLDEILQLPITIKNRLEKCVQNLTGGITLGSMSLCGTLAQVDEILTRCFAAQQTMTLRCLINGLLDLGSNLLESVVVLLPMLILLVQALLACANDVLVDVFLMLNTVINTDVQACRTLPADDGKT